MNKYQLMEYLFYNQTDISDFKAFRPIMVQVIKIEYVKIDGGHHTILYTVDFIKAIGFEIKDRGIRSDKQMSEGCLCRSVDVLKALHDKGHGR